MKDYEKIEVSKKSCVAQIKLNSPETMNALDAELFEELEFAVRDVSEDDAVGAVVLTGSGKAFCAGGDLKRFADGFSPHEGYMYMKRFSSFINSFANMPKPTIAAVNGYAVGAGFCLALLADIILASKDAKFGMAFVNVGLIPDFGGLYTLPRLIGVHKAKELVMTGRNISADEADKMGILNYVTEPRDLERESLYMAKRLASGPPVAHKMAKLLINASSDMSLDGLLEQEALMQAQCMQTEDHKDALKSFFAKEAPLFRFK